MTVNDFWQEFIATNNKDSKTPYIEYIHFELTERLANELLELVLLEKK